MATSMQDSDAITRAVREYNAAQNSLRRAYRELLDTLPTGVRVLHRCPPFPDEPAVQDTTFWLYERHSDRTEWLGEGTLSAHALVVGENIVIITAPSPREEYLPRLIEEPGQAPRASGDRPTEEPG
jgi:hypothetical protein